MKLIRYLKDNQALPGIELDGIRYDLSPFGSDYDEKFFASGGLGRLKSFITKNQGTLKKLDSHTRLAAPVARPSKIVCVGLNYADHARETKAEPPGEPVLFMKSTTALCGPFDNIIIPKNSKKTDWEVELAVVMGKKASYVEEQDAAEYIAGYCLHNDVSEREFQIERSGTWDKGKGCDTFAPLGPWLVTPDEIADVNKLRLWLKLNGKLMQDGTTANLIFKIPFLISYISQFMTLLPGDIISTGTPAGVGLGMKPPTYLQPGDIVELGIDGLGVARQELVSCDPSLK
ncbi:MAG: fumarylacetoacetate hydrolase family protein [Bacteroidota bacterium]|nr:fumarylacetoacetate hydrolase family protein [Bacteroidota bacterium]MDP4212016.1 fumarylacetoacetate hydrolase family protein [Bacteroidota bacterium]MDP4249952.1 fumarylacetoacetate hydrolase family protein [Bacteroidota bacterium]